MKTIAHFLEPKTKPFFIGVAGVAGAGKDLFFKCLKEELSAQKTKIERRAIADGLKEEISSFSTTAYAIDPRSCSRKEKEQIRPLLVFHGAMRRKESKGRYWIDLFESNYRVHSDELKREGKKEPDIVCITDIRFDDHERDEVYWLKNELRGVMVHVSQYTKEKDRKKFRSPANEEEKRNDPRLKAKADYSLEWEYKHSGGELSSMCRGKAQKFIEWLSAHALR